MAITVKEITQEIHDLVCFLEPVESLLNSHLGSFFTEDLWNKHVPSNILSELNNLNSINSFIEIYPKIVKGNCPNKFAEDHPNLLNFINKAIKVSIIKKEKYKKLLFELENLFTKSTFGDSCAKVEKFMTTKKLHEVKSACKMTAFVSDVTKSSHIVDVGGGKGYLSCALVLNYSFKVLGLDFSQLKTCGAVKRSESMAKFWNGESFSLSKDSQFKDVCNKKTRQQFVQNHYKQITTFVKPDTDAEALLKESFNEDITGITLTGLHTCGDLAPTCLKLFLNCKKIKGLVNFGCCYNHISEEFIEDDDLEENTNLRTKNYGFPMSSFLRGKKYKLGRSARMVACHSLDRIYSNSEFESSQTSLFYRAILETIIRKTNLPMGKGKVGRFFKKCNSFNDYICTALKKLEINIKLEEKDLDELYEYYAEKKPFLTAYYLLKISLAPVVESIILLDRILYLIENDVSNVYLVPLFDLEVSPRGFGIIAWKNYEKC